RVARRAPGAARLRRPRATPHGAIVRVTLAVVGRVRAPFADAATTYETRAARYWPLDVHEVREEPARGNVAPDAVRRREAERLLARLPAGAHVVACDERGATFTSERFAGWLAEQRDRAQDVAFVIGGAYGLDGSVRERADSVISLAPWTLPHELARVVLAEQLYRAGTIARGEPYHK
ncbi:MAG TPA: 23S rRNA (pseudouridine(1915)-N(3))-methyltransferase RlmH, partial [Gemmatimonadales bacterium]